MAAAAKQALEDREDLEFLKKTPNAPAALLAVRMMMPVIDKMQAEINELKAPPQAPDQSRSDSEHRLFLHNTPASSLTAEEKTEKIILESRYMILGNISDVEENIERLTHNVNCLAALLSVFIQELDPAAFKRGKEGVDKARRFAKEWQEDPGMVK
jgi:hypothetical protein